MAGKSKAKLSCEVEWGEGKLDAKLESTKVDEARIQLH